MAAVAAAGIAVLLRRLRGPDNQRRSEQACDAAVRDYAAVYLRRLRRVETVDIELPDPDVDIRETVDLTETSPDQASSSRPGDSEDNRG